MGTLIFPHGASHKGFTDPVTSSSRNTPEPIIRELLQNCLDAAEDTGLDAEGKSNPAEIHFTISEREIDDIPGIQNYRSAFEKACKERSRQKQGEDEKRIIKRIENVLSQRTTKVLFCRDNGVGLCSERITYLLWPGNTTKEEGQAGAFGLGHLFAFQASDLRYVLYSGRSKNENLQEFTSGHAILAAHPDEDGDRCDPDGFWVEGEMSQKFNEDPVYSKEVPNLLKTQLEAISNSASGTGAVISVLGFNDFLTEESGGATAEIRDAAARNFFAAIYNGFMRIHILDETDGGSSFELNKDTVEKALSGIQSEQRARLSGFLAGRRAYEAFQTLKYGEEFQVADAKIMLRKIDDSETRKQREINLCRNGMWITHTIPECGTSDFAQTRPFNAVILLDDKDGELHKLVRNAEGPEHREIDKKRLDKHEKQKMTGLLRDVAAKIREEAGEVDDSDDFRPQGFAIVQNAEIKQAAKRKPLRPAGSHPSGQSRKPSKPGKKREKRQNAPPNPGAATPTHISSRPVRKNGSVKQILASLSFPEGKPVSPYLGVRVYLEGGSDESCEQPFRFQPLKLEEISSQAGSELPAKSNPWEILIPTSDIAASDEGISGETTPTTQSLRITLEQPLSIQEASATRIEVYRRKKAAASEDDAEHTELEETET